MKRIRIGASALLATTVTASCSDRNTLTAPPAGAQAATAVLADRPYTWSVSCHGGWVLFAQWSWTEKGVAVASGSASCSSDQALSGTGVRPASANGFTAQVGTTSQTWTFDPAGAFKASLSGSMGGGGGHCFICLGKESGKLTVDS